MPSSRRLEAARKYGVVSKDLRMEAVKLLVPLARDGKSLEDAVAFLKAQGIAVTDANAKRLYDAAVKQAAPKAASRRRQKVRDWLHGRSRFFQILEKAGAYGKVVPSERFRGQQFSGSFIDPDWVRYSGRSFRNVSESDISAKLAKAVRDHSAFSSDMLAKMYADEFGGDAVQIEEEMLDYFDGKTWQGLESEMLEEERSMAAEWRGQEEDAWRAWLEKAMPVAEEHVRRRLPLTREMAEDEPDLARLVCELYDGVPEQPLSHGFRDVSDEWLEGFNYAVAKGMRSRLGEFADAYEQAYLNPVYGDSRPLPARAFDIMERTALRARAAGAERELRRKNSRIAELETAEQRAAAMLEEARAALDEERRARLSDVSELRAPQFSRRPMAQQGQNHGDRRSGDRGRSCGAGAARSPVRAHSQNRGNGDRRSGDRDRSCGAVAPPRSPVFAAPIGKRAIVFSRQLPRGSARAGHLARKGVRIPSPGPVV